MSDLFCLEGERSIREGGEAGPGQVGTTVSLRRRYPSPSQVCWGPANWLRILEELQSFYYSSRKCEFLFLII